MLSNASARPLSAWDGARTITCPIWLTSNSPARSRVCSVFLHHAHRVLNRHLIAGKRHHLGTQARHADLFSGVLADPDIRDPFGICRDVIRGLISSGTTFPHGVPRTGDAPSVLSPEIVIPSADARFRDTTLQSLGASAWSFCLRVSGAVAPSALAMPVLPLRSRH